jgi:hypothetical protein
VIGGKMARRKGFPFNHCMRHLFTRHATEFEKIGVEKKKGREEI